MKKISNLLIVLGIAIALIPLYNQIYSMYWQNKALEAYESLDTVFLEEPENISPDIIVSDPNANIYFPPDDEGLTQNGEVYTDVPDQTVTSTDLVEATAPVQPTTAKVTTAKKTSPQAIGILTIDKIKLKLPIFSGASNANLKIGVGWMKETASIGQNGNAALAAHRSHTYGRFFNRLDELQIDDTFTISVGDQQYKYVVFNKVVVEPTDVSVLKQNKKEQVVTLITCTPLITATHRLIIQARLY